jgi:hypothetical protein
LRAAVKACRPAGLFHILPIQQAGKSALNRFGFWRQPAFNALIRWQMEAIDVGSGNR